MKRLFAALLLLPLVGAPAAAQPAGDGKAGKALWDSNQTQCRNCHGNNGEGAFGPDLAGRGLSVAQFRQALRKPWGIMPRFGEAQISDAEVGDLVAWFQSLPANPQPGKWRFEVPANAPVGQATLLEVGCGQCHSPAFQGPRAGLGATDADFATFKKLVYEHTTAMTDYVRSIGERPPPRFRMGDFNPARLTEAQLQAIYDWARNDIGFRVNVTARLSAGTTATNGVTYTLTVENAGLPDKAKVAEDLTIRLIIPVGSEVVATTGGGYQGVQADAAAKANVALWQLPRIAPKEHQTYTITLSRPGTASDNLRGEIRWSKPAVKTGPFDQNAIAPAPL